MMTVFLFASDVRARDPNLRWINSECRRSLTSAECTAVADVVLLHCRFEPNWSSVPDAAVCIVPTKKAEMDAMDTILQGRQTITFHAVDEVQNGAKWDKATERVTWKLNQNCYEYDLCRLYVGAIVRMTYNKRAGAVPFSQGQVAVVVELPRIDSSIVDQKLRLRLAPPGERNIDVNNIPVGWPQVYSEDM